MKTDQTNPQDSTAAYVERGLEGMIRRHGIATVRRHIDALLCDQANWPTYQRLVNLANNVNRRIVRQGGR